MHSFALALLTTLLLIWLEHRFAPALRAWLRKREPLAHRTWNRWRKRKASPR